MPKILVGADPELFMRNPNDGSFVSAHGRVPGTKWEPFAVPHGAIQVDGTALEFNIDPAVTIDEFVNNINAVRATLESYVPGFNVCAEPVALFEDKYFQTVPASAQELGCMPDFNAWTMVANARPDPGALAMRTAAGHIHIGWTKDADVYDKDHYELAGAVSRHLDYYLGAHSLLWDSDSTRRQLYGKAGAFRPKTYGVEYRVLSNRWLNSEALMRWVYDTTQTAMGDFFAGHRPEEKHGELARHIIDNNILDWQQRYPTLDLGLQKVPA